MVPGYWWTDYGRGVSGIRKEQANIHYWAKEIAPSNELRKWYQHDPDKWNEFKRRYYDELNAKPEALEAFKAQFTGETVTFLFSSKERELNNAVALKEYVVTVMESGLKGR